VGTGQGHGKPASAVHRTGCAVLRLDELEYAASRPAGYGHGSYRLDGVHKPRLHDSASGIDPIDKPRLDDNASGFDRIDESRLDDNASGFDRIDESRLDDNASGFDGIDESTGVNHATRRYDISTGKRRPNPEHRENDVRARGIRHCRRSHGIIHALEAGKTRRHGRTRDRRAD
jgi:hypothetical protein